MTLFTKPVLAVVKSAIAELYSSSEIENLMVTYSLPIKAKPHYSNKTAYVSAYLDHADLANPATSNALEDLVTQMYLENGHLIDAGKDGHQSNPIYQMMKLDKGLKSIDMNWNGKLFERVNQTKVVQIENGSLGVVSPLKKPKELRTTFSKYAIGKLLGEGGAGFVYGATDDDRKSVAIKILNPVKATTEKLKRFRNELRFCMQNKHPNIVKVLDNGITTDDHPFFVMPLYEGSLRKVIGKLSPSDAFAYFKKIIDGVDAAHKSSTVHRDLKPENILLSTSTGEIVVSDFGIADFEEDEIYSTVETKVGAHIGNYQYAAPEQRARGKQIDKRADIYALGLILNELFTSEIPHGLNFKSIGSVATDFSYLDIIVSKMLEQNPNNRYPDLDSLKYELNLKGQEYISKQKISVLNSQVIPEGEVDDLIVANPIQIVGVDWEKSVLTIELSQAPSSMWIWALNNMGGHTSALGHGPETFRFDGNKAIVHVGESDAQRVIDFFKQWLPRVAQIYKHKLTSNLREKEQNERDSIAKIKREEAQRMKVKTGLKF